MRKPKFTSRAMRLDQRVWSRIGLGPPLTLGLKLTLVAVLELAALVGLFAYLGTAALNTSIQHSLEERAVLAGTMAQTIDYALANIEHILTDAAQDQGLNDAAHRAQSLREVYTRTNFYGNQVFLLDRTTHVIAADPPINYELAFPDAQSVEAVLRGQSFAVSRRAHQLSPGKYSTLAVAPVRNSQGEIVAALVLSIDFYSPNLRAFTSPTGLASSGYLDLIDMDGFILASTRPARAGTPSDHNATLAQMIQARQTVVSRCHDCHDASAAAPPRPEVLAFAPLTRAQWGIAVRQDEQEVFAPARELQSQIFGLGGLILVGVLFLVYLVTRSVIRPVQTLTTAAHRIAAGDLDSPITLRGRDEIGVLAHTFDIMRAKLKDSLSEIQAFNRELDARVQERTAALALAQQDAQQSRDELQTIIDSLSVELVVVDRNYRVVRVNAVAAAQQPAGLTLIGAPCFQLNHDGIRCITSECECPVRQVLQTGKPARVAQRHQPNGAMRYVEVTASPLFNSAGQVEGVVELRRDVTQEKQLAETIFQRNRELSAVNAIARAVGQSLKLDECLRLALSEVRRITELDVGAIFLTEGEDRVPTLHSFYGIANEDVVTRQLSWQEAACARAWENRETVAVRNAPDTLCALCAALPRDTLASVVHIPLIAKGIPLGALCLGARTARTFTEDEISLLSAIGSQIAIAVENARLYEELSHKEQLRGELLRRVISTQEDERRRIARELHDETSQTLTALLYTVDTAAQTCATPDAYPFMDKLRQLTITALDDVQKVILDLRPRMLDQLGLVAALRSYAKARLGENGIQVECTELGSPRRLSSSVETALFRAAQEALNNVARHSRASSVRIVCLFQEDAVELSVEDDGMGFDPNRVVTSTDPRCGLGLVGMWERMKAVGGELFLNSTPGYGTTVRLRVPLKEDGYESDQGAGS